MLEDSRQLWDSHARHDPLWAILSEPGKKGGRWDVTRFFQTGVGEISFILYQLHSRGIVVGRRSALDFGCGVGRLTQALAPHFEEVVGVDVSPRMIELAAGFNRFPQRARYVSNQRADLTAWRDDTFDFIVSNIVLQHIRPEITFEYLREFHRVLGPGGILVFQLPSHQRGPDDPPPAPPMRAMPDDAYHASIRAVRIPNGPRRAASALTLELEVTNASAFHWSEQQFGVMRIGNHWLNRSGDQMLLRDDGRTSLPDSLPPGDRCRLSLTVAIPSEAGEFVCEIDLCHEGVVWFGEKGSPVVRFPVRVGAAEDGDFSLTNDAPPSLPAVPPVAEAARAQMPALDGADGGVDDPPPFPMYGIQKDTVIDFVRSQGGELIHVENDPSCGADWVSFRYYVQLPVLIPGSGSGISGTGGGS